MSNKLIFGISMIAGASADGKTIAPVPNYAGSQAAVEVPPVPVCKDGSIYDPSAGCAYVDFADPKPSCPHPYKMDKHSGACVTSTYGESSTICPNGSYLEKHKCISEITAPVDVFCKHVDAVLSEEGCIRRAEPEYYPDEYLDPDWTCPHKYKLIDPSTCVLEVANDVELYCEEGWTLHGKKCVTMDVTNAFCDKGYTFNGDICDLIEITQPIGRCPKHTVEMKGQCMQEIVEKPSFVCEKGYDLNHKGKCEARVLIQAVLDSKKGASYEFDCKHGQIDPKTGECYQVHYSEPVAVCDNGFEMQKKKCISYVPLDYEFECPKGYMFGKDGTCTRSGHMKPRCPKGFKMDGAGMCSTHISQKAATSCPKGTSSLQGSKKDCTTLEYAQPTPSCKHGYSLEKARCVKPGFVKAGKDKIHEPVYDCPKGFKLNKAEGLCYSFIEAEPEPLCEKGYTLEKKKCIAYHQVAPQAICPKGFVNDTVSTRCMRTSYTRPVFECPKGTEEHGKRCYVYQDLDIQMMPLTDKKRI